MRWFVEISPLGQKAGPSTILCVEAPQWQPALQKARAMRGDDGAMSNFSIELLEDGFRAIDPATRLRFVVKRAPDDAALSATPTPAPAAPAAEKPAPQVAVPAPEAKKRPLAQTVAFVSPGAAVVNQPAPATAAVPTPEARKRPLAQTVAFSSPGVVAVREPAPAPEPPPAKPAPAAVVSAPKPEPAGEPVPSFVLVGAREDNPTESSPLTYREFVYAVGQGTSEQDARRLILDRFETVLASIGQARAGKLINLAVFDHVFHGKPLRRPLVTLTWKDWKPDPPEIRFPEREGGTPSARSLTPLGTPVVPPSAPAAAAKAAVAAEPAPKAEPSPKPAGPKLASGTPSAAQPTPEVERVVAPRPVKVPEAPRVAEAPTTPFVKPIIAIEAAPRAPAEPASPAAPVPESRAAPTLASPGHEAAPRGASPSPKAAAPADAPKAAAPRTAAAASSRPSAPKKRLSGDDLLAELFEAFGDLQFLRDSLEGAEFVLALTLEQLPSRGRARLALRHEHARVRGRAPVGRAAERALRAAAGARARRGQRHAQAPRDRRRAIPAGAARAMDDRFRAIGVEIRSLVTAPVELGGRYLGLIELANPLDGGVFTDGDGNALTYIGEQFAEFVAAHGVIVDPEQIRAPPRALYDGAAASGPKARPSAAAAQRRRRSASEPVAGPG